MRDLGQLILAVIVVVLALMAFRAVAGAALTSGGAALPKGARTVLRQPGVPRAARGGAVRSMLAFVTRPGIRQARAKARADIVTAWHKAAAADWLERRRLERRNAPAIAPPAPASAPGTPRRRLPALRRLGGLVPFRPRPADPADGGAAPAPIPVPRTLSSEEREAAARLRQRFEEMRRNGEDPYGRPVPAARQSPPDVNGGTTVPTGTSTAGAEQLIEGINRIHAEAAAGGIRHKQAAVKAAAEGCIRFSGVAQMLARTMSEPGNNYGPEITEPLGKAAVHLQAAAMAFGESDTALATLIHMTVGELADSPRQAPHHSELNEAGAR